MPATALAGSSRPAESSIRAVSRSLAYLVPAKPTPCEIGRFLRLGTALARRGDSTNRPLGRISDAIVAALQEWHQAQRCSRSRAACPCSASCAARPGTGAGRDLVSLTTPAVL